MIFSSTSDIANERQNSVCSSSESTSLVDSMNPEGSKAEESGDIPTLKEFDFLEGEEVDREVCIYIDFCQDCFELSKFAINYKP